MSGHPTLLTPRVLIPFIIITLIWGSTWVVIRGQLGDVPPSWSVCYRFLVAAAAMFILAAVRGERLRLPTWRVHGFALVLGILQFACNFNFVYRAEGFITSGLVAVLFALLIVPNTMLSRLIYATRLQRNFMIGAGVAVTGILLLLIHEGRRMDVMPADVLAGAALTLAGVLCASIANVMQSSRIARDTNALVLIAWAMTWGMLADALWAWTTTGAPVVDWRPGYILGVLYLGLFGSVICFPLYFGIIRAVGAGPAAWSSVIIPVIAMGLSTLVEGYGWSLLAGSGALLALAGLAIAVRPRSTGGQVPEIPASSA